jgi:preprotein translocase subunit SecD
MRNLILLAFATLLMGCTTTKVSCSSFSLHIAADEHAVVDPVEYEKVQVAFYQARNPEPLWILRHSSFDGRDLEKVFITKQKPLTPEQIEATKSLHFPPEVEKAFATGGQLHINIKLRDDAKSKLEDVSSKNVGKQMAMLLDGVVIMAPVIREPLHEVEFQITGRYTEEEANRIVDRLNMISGCK